MGRARRGLRVIASAKVSDERPVGVVSQRMKRALAGLCLLFLLCVTGCGSGHAQVLGSAQPVRNVLVYAKVPPPYELGGKESVWLANVDGRHPRLLAEDADAPAVSPDGRSVAYDSGGNVLVRPTTGGKPRIIYRHGGYPTWAPDSRHIAVFADGIVILDLRTGRQTTIDRPASSISFSPDSTRVVYGTELPTGGDLWVTSIHGGRPPVQITDDSNSFGPVWGPNGIAFRRFSHGSNGHIWLTGPRPNDARQLTHIDAGLWPASFSGDGKKLLAAYPAMHNGRLWAVDVASGRARPITPWLGDLYAQGLSTDGKTVLAAVGCGGMPSPYGYIETIPFAGGKPHVITKGPCRASWNAGY